MKRGLIGWSRDDLPPAVFDARLSAIHRLCTDFDVAALMAYTDVCRANDVRYISNYMPYWNRALTVVPRDQKPILLCALSPRVYPWIKSITVHETIVPSPSLSGQLVKLCAERGWLKIGVLDQAGLPNDLYAQLAAEKLLLVDIPRGALRPVVTDSELAMHRRAAQIARESLEAHLTRDAIGLTDHALVGRLERALRRAGAEDLLVLISNGRTPPLPAAGHLINENSSVTLALEYNGHWAKLSRNTVRLTCVLPPPADAPGTHRELLSGRYPWEGIVPQEDSRSVITSIHVTILRGDNRLYYGDTGIQGRDGWQEL
jgi:hypothetical protein